MHGLFKERLLLQLHHIQQARTTILLKNMLSMRLWKRNKYKKAPNISRFEQKTKIAKQKMPIESFLFQYIYKTWKPNWLNTEPRKVQNKQL